MRLILGLCALLLPTLPAWAGHEHHHGGEAQTAAPSAAPGAALSDGVVKKIDKAAGEVVIQHGPLPSIGMPAMTMSFGVADPRWLDKFSPGMKIRFAAAMKREQVIVSRYEVAP
ncbi:MAG: hypothetical protein RIR00_1825 [Pseudomonadota bacterium]|jgi:Cu/Ag efflux protein CusF